MEQILLVKDIKSQFMNITNYKEVDKVINGLITEFKEDRMKLDYLIELF